MISVARTLSLRYFQQRWGRALLIVASIGLGVATLIATQTLNNTMSQTVNAGSNPLAGGADLIVTKDDGKMEPELARKLERLPGIRQVRRFLLDQVQLPQCKNDDKPQTVVLIGVGSLDMLQGESNPWGVTLHWLNIPQVKAVFYLRQLRICAVGEELHKRLKEILPSGIPLILVQATGGNQEPIWLLDVGTVSAEGTTAMLGGNILYTPLDTANHILGHKSGTTNRLDLVLEPGADLGQVRRRVEHVLDRRHEVKTPEELIASKQSVMAGMQAGFTLSGLGALVVGMFLVYNALAVTVAERRHEIGILRSLGATRRQVQALFAGEAAILGIFGAAVGVPLGLTLAYLALDPMTQVISDVFFALEAHQVEWTLATVVLALAAGLLTALLAALIPAVRASNEQPAEAVRRIPPRPTWSHRFLQVAGSVLLILLGVGLILLRKAGLARLGSYGGLALVLLGALVATPLLAALAARLLQPLARRFLSVEGRLAADNLVRSPARTGLVIAALAAGVALMVQTAGTLRSNRDSVDDWLQRYLTADLIVTSRSLASAAGQSRVLDAGLGDEMERLDRQQIKAVLPVRILRRSFKDTQVSLVVIEARKFCEVAQDHRPQMPGLELYRQLDEKPGSVFVSDNFTALHGVTAGQQLSLSGVRWRVLGQIRDFSWNHGAVFMDWADYCHQMDERQDQRVNMLYVYLNPGAEPSAVKEAVVRHFKGKNDVGIYTHAEWANSYLAGIDRLYAMAYGQQFIVGVVAALGVVTALLISVLQRRREMGVLRAIGATRFQIVRCVLAEAALMGVIGTAIGLVVGIPLEWYILQVVILEESGYLFPVVIPWLEAGLIAACALALATLAGLGPALNAMRHRIPEAIAHE